jgi:hypothetical protein
MSSGRGKRASKGFEAPPQPVVTSFIGESDANTGSTAASTSSISSPAAYDMNADPDRENINMLVQAYSTVPIINSLVLGFVVSLSCQCSSAVVNLIVDTICLVTVVSSVLAITAATVTIYHILYITANYGARRGRDYIDKTSKYRGVSRYATYASLALFVVSYTICLCARSSRNLSLVFGSITATGAVVTYVIFLSFLKEFNHILRVERSKKLKTP